ILLVVLLPLVATRRVQLVGHLVGDGIGFLLRRLAWLRYLRPLMPVRATAVLLCRGRLRAIGLFPLDAGPLSLNNVSELVDEKAVTLLRPRRKLTRSKMDIMSRGESAR